MSEETPQSPLTMDLSEMKAQQEKMNAFYKQNIPFLKAQATYTGLMADVAENFLRKEEATLKLGHLKAAMEQAEKKFAESSEKKEPNT